MTNFRFDGLASEAPIELLSDMIRIRVFEE